MTIKVNFSIIIIITATIYINQTRAEENKTLNSICEKESSAWCLPPDYDKSVEPWIYKHLSNASLPWILDFTFSIFEIEKVDDKERTILLKMYFIIKWLEPRLNVNLSAPDWNDSIKANWSFVPINYMNKFWYPDLDLQRMKKFETKKVLKDMASLKVNSSKWLRYSARVDITLSCHMTFEDYPLDGQECPLLIGSYYSPIDIVNCTSELDYNNNSQPMLHHHLDIEALRPSMLQYDWGEQTWATCGFNIVLHRTRIQNLFEVYLTCTLLVIISWISFIIPPNIVPGRMGLLVITFLALINIFIEVKGTAPISNGLNAYDIFLVMCIAQVFLACMEYAVVLRSYGFNEKISSLSFREIEMKQFSGLKEPRKKTKHVRRIDLDRWALISFPSVFILMITVYCFKFI